MLYIILLYVFLLSIPVSIVSHFRTHTIDNSHMREI